MAKTVGYIRVSTVKQDSENQRLEISTYAERNNLKVDDFIDVEISSRKSMEDRRIEELLSNLKKGDTLIVSELSRLGRSVRELSEIVDRIIKKGINLHCIKQGWIINGKHDMTSKMIMTMFVRIPMIRTTDSEGKRPLIPIEGGHLFRVNPATLPNRKQC